MDRFLSNPGTAISQNTIEILLLRVKVSHLQCLICQASSRNNH